MPWLTTEGGSHEIAEGETVVGSGPDAKWRLPALDLAARHFALRREGGRVTLRPCGIDAIITINGKQTGAQGVGLKDGDLIDAGHARFLFTVDRRDAHPAASISPAHLIDTRTGVAYALATTSSGIGRDRLNSVVVKNPTASRFHAEIRSEAGGYVLHPKGSSGTLLNGRRVGSPERLQDGDAIEIANVELRFAAGAVPAGAMAAERVPDDESGHRPTVLEIPAVEIPGEGVGRPKSLLWLGMVVVLGVLVVVAAIAYYRR
jgi:predicted component of type VI protein secretion system